MMKMRESLESKSAVCKECGAKLSKGKKHNCKKDCGDKGTGSKPMK